MGNYGSIIVDFNYVYDECGKRNVVKGVLIYY